jgi:uncharacterized protein
MQIRTITCFDDVSFPIAKERLRAIGLLAAAVRGRLQDAGYEVQTVRLALPPLSRTIGADASKAVALARDLESACGGERIDYATIGAVRAGDPASLFAAVPDAIAATSSIFASCLIAEAGAGIDLAAVRGAANIIDRCSRLTPDGFGNLRFAALARVPSGVPFLPAAYHDGAAPGVAIGVEAASLAVAACEGAASQDEARRTFVDSIEKHARRIAAAAETACAGVTRFAGIDFSLAPFPDRARSAGTAIERLSGSRVGEHGTLAATAWLADAIDRASFPRAGYSGVFLPVFEDAVVAARAAEGLVSVADLLLWSSVCGTGLDTVPLPGDVGQSAIAAILLDVAALALRLDKPLTARLMPIPGKRAGEEVSFDFPYFAPTRVLAARSSGVGGLFADSGAVTLLPSRGAKPAQ